MASTSKDEFIPTDRRGIWQHYLCEKKGAKAQCKECGFKCEGAYTMYGVYCSRLVGLCCRFSV